MVYAIKTRNGQVYLKLKRNFGDLSALQVRPLACRLLETAQKQRRLQWRMEAGSPPPTLSSASRSLSAPPPDSPLLRCPLPVTPHYRKRS